MIGNTPGMPPTTPIETSPPSEQRSRSSRYPTIFAGAVVLLTVVSIALAALAPHLAPGAQNAIPANWARIYDAKLTGTGDSRWESGHGCQFVKAGLTIKPVDGSGASVSAAPCPFTPSQRQDLTSKGFYFEVTLAPSNATDQQQVGVIYADTAVLVAFDQSGQYLACRATCGSDVSTYATGTTIAWHSDPYVANAFAVKLAEDGTTLTIYANGQQVAQEQVELARGMLALSLGTSQDSSAIFTHATLYSGSATQLGSS